MNEACAVIRTPNTHATTVWYILLASAFIHVPITLPEHNIIVQLAAFDLALPLIILFGFNAKWLVLPPRRILLISLGIVTAILLHSVTAYLLIHPILELTLLKEALKLTVIFVNFVLLIVLFGNEALRQPPSIAAQCLLILFIPIVLLSSHYEPIFITRTVYAVSLSGLVFLLAMNSSWRHEFWSRANLLFTCLAVTVTAIMVYNKGAAGLMIAAIAWIALEGRFATFSAARICLLSVLAVGAIVGGVILTAYLGESIGFLERMDSIERSIFIRLTLWNLALERFLETFPFGLGLGQFSLAAKTVPQLAAEGHKFVHNSLLGLMVELGALGLLLGGGMFTLVLYAARGLPKFVTPLYLILVLPPLLIHDGHSIRMLSIITALGLARFLYRRGSAQEEQPASE